MSNATAAPWREERAAISPTRPGPSLRKAHPQPPAGGWTSPPRTPPHEQIPMLLKLRGWTYTDLHRVTGINYETLLRQAKRGTSKLNTVNATLIADALGVEVPDLMPRVDLGRPASVSAVDDALSDEIAAATADREWTLEDSAQAFGMSMADLKARLGGYRPWTVADLFAAADALDPDDPRAEFMRLGEIAERVPAAFPGQLAPGVGGMTR